MYNTMQSRHVSDQTTALSSLPIDFTYRPTSHFIAPDSWMNDPCGAVYVPETKEYLFCYQWHPGTTEGGNSAWGMAKSRDLITWEDCTPPITTGASYDRFGVFSGSVISRVIDGRRVLFLFYTSVSALPIHWSKDYIKGCESQSVAYSIDFGKSWHRYENNPLLTAPPKKAATTGWRDPFVSKWERLSAMLGNHPSTDYMMISSGQKGEGPQLHLYQSHNLLDWEALATPLLSVEANSKPSPTSSLNFGMNFECGSFFSIQDRHYIIVGVEEDGSSHHHNQHYLLWLSGNLVLKDGKPKFEITNHGVLDHGLAYAAHIFRDEEGRLLQLAWADEAAKKELVSKQGWAGCLTHPRELYEISVPGMTPTLGVRPAPQLQTLRNMAQYIPLVNFPALQSMSFEFEATFCHVKGDEKFIFNVRESSSEVTRVIFDLGGNLITVDRSKSSLGKLGTDTPDSGFFELLPGEDHLHIHVFVDNSIVEIFANDRFALTSRIYPSLEASIGVSYDFGRFDTKNNVKFQCWEGLAAAWPHRDAYAQQASVELHTKIIEEKIPLQLTEPMFEGDIYA